MGATVVLLTDDLMFGSKVESMIHAAGAEPVLTAEPEKALSALNAASAPALLVVDLVTDAFDQMPLPGRAAHPAIGYYAHTDDDTRRTALAAGYAQVVPRSRMMREGVALIAAQLAAPTG
ncbi:MAG: hypothetical protein HZB14_06865 [Actinobacteria bacterium]|nr:hypothetical protein [Actinomycetota bacterium]